MHFALERGFFLSFYCNVFSSSFLSDSYLTATGIRLALQSLQYAGCLSYETSAITSIPTSYRKAIGSTPVGSTRAYFFIRNACVTDYKTSPFNNKEMFTRIITDP